MNKRESAIISAYTGYLCGNFDDMQKYADELFGYPTFTHQFGNIEFINELHNKAKNDFVNLKIE